MESCVNCCKIKFIWAEKVSIVSAILSLVLGILALTFMKGTVSYSVGGTAAGLFILTLVLTYCLLSGTICLKEHIKKPIEVSKRKYWEVIEKLSQIDAKYYPFIFNFCNNPETLSMNLLPIQEEVVASSVNGRLLQVSYGNYVFDEETRVIILNTLEWVRGEDISVWQVANKLSIIYKLKQLILGI